MLAVNYRRWRWMMEISCNDWDIRASWRGFGWFNPLIYLIYPKIIVYLWWRNKTKLGKGRPIYGDTLSSSYPCAAESLPVMRFKCRWKSGHSRTTSEKNLSCFTVYGHSFEILWAFAILMFHGLFLCRASNEESYPVSLILTSVWRWGWSFRLGL